MNNESLWERLKVWCWGLGAFYDPRTVKEALDRFNSISNGNTHKAQKRHAAFASLLLKIWWTIVPMIILLYSVSNPPKLPVWLACLLLLFPMFLFIAVGLILYKLGRMSDEQRFISLVAKGFWNLSQNEKSELQTINRTFKQCIVHDPYVLKKASTKFLKEIEQWNTHDPLMDLVREELTERVAFDRLP